MAVAWLKKSLGPTGSVMEESEPDILDFSLSLTFHNYSSLTTGSTFKFSQKLATFLSFSPLPFCSKPPFTHYSFHTHLPIFLTTARGIVSILKSDHITPLRQILQWLISSFRVTVKGLSMAYKSLHDLSPLHLHNIRSHYFASRSLCFSHTCFLAGPWHKQALPEKIFSQICK